MTLPATPASDALSRLPREAMWYTAAAAVVGLVPTAAEAQVVYTDVDPDEFVADGSFFIDFDGDGDAELEMNEDDVDNNGNPRDFTRAYKEAEVAPDSISGIASQIVPFPGGGDYAYPIPLDAGVSVGPDVPELEDFYTFSFTFTGDDPLGWKGAGEKYIGVRLRLTDGAGATTTHFGWVLMEIPVQGGSMIIKSYAYESTPDTPILTGATVAIDPGPDGTPGTHAFRAAPNPFRHDARLTLEVAETQAVRVAVYDALGREVAVLHDGPLASGREHAFTLAGAELPGGVYVVRATGAAFSDTRTVTLAR